MLRSVRGVHPFTFLLALGAVGSGLYFFVEPGLLWALPIAVFLSLGTEGVLRSHPRFPTEARWQVETWILPALVFLAGVLLVSLFSLQGPVRTIALLLLSLLLAAAIGVKYVILNGPSAWALSARWAWNVIVYITFLALALAFLTTRLSLLLSSLGIGVAAFLLTLSLVWGAPRGLGQSLMYSAIVGLAIGEARWALSLLPLAGPMVVVLLFPVFYLFTGLVQSHLYDRIKPSFVLELATVVVAAVLLFYWLYPWSV